MKALHMLHQLKTMALDKQSRELAKSGQQVVRQQLLLTQLLAFQQEMRCGMGTDSALSLHNRSIMHHRLGQLIEQQADEIALSKLQQKQQQKMTLQALIANKGTEIALNKAQQRRTQQLALREQRVSDELAIQSYYRNRNAKQTP
ncbi:MAG: flagellar FliJ family protein [Aeromonas sobria]